MPLPTLQVNFTAPVAIQTNTTYVASYHTNVGYYAATSNGLAAASDNAPLHALASGTDGSNGLYVYSQVSAFPNQSYNNTNYWVDVVYTATPPPVISGAVVGSITSSGVTVAWNTDVAADSQLEYGAIAGYGSASLLDGTPLNTHVEAVGGLTPGTTYHYRIRSRSGRAGCQVPHRHEWVYLRHPLL